MPDESFHKLPIVIRSVWCQYKNYGESDYLGY